MCAKKPPVAKVAPVSHEPWLSRLSSCIVLGPFQTEDVSDVLCSDSVPTISESGYMYTSCFSWLYTMHQLVRPCSQMYTFQEACGSHKNVVKNETFEHLIRVGAGTHTSLYDPASPDHINAIRTASIWASISTALDTPNMTGESSPKFFYTNVSGDM